MAAKTPEDMLNDVSFIQDMRHTRGPWQQYDVLLAARGYGWDYMVDTAAYMESADLQGISTLTTAEAAFTPEVEHIDAYRASGEKLRTFPLLREEQGMLSIGGISRALMSPVKIVWYNQTRTMRFFTPVDDETLLKKYAETVIRRTFGTRDAMKLGKPVPTGK